MTYRPEGSCAGRTVALAPATCGELKACMPKVRKPAPAADDFFRLLRDEGVTMLDFNHCHNAEQMQALADSPFRTLRRESSRHPVIDVRRNGGGNAIVGDVPLRDVVKEPFRQMDKALMRISPTTQRLLRDWSMATGWYFTENNAPDRFTRPLTAEEGHYGGDARLLTSQRTSSAASSFAWALKTFGGGRGVGEETGGMGVSSGDFRVYRLPAADLACAISYKRFRLPGADGTDVHGALPDVAVPQEEALDAALDLIRPGK